MLRSTLASKENEQRLLAQLKNKDKPRSRSVKNLMAKTFTAQQMKPLFDKEFFITKLKIEDEKKQEDSEDEW